MRVSLLGPRGTFSEEAALKFFKDPEMIYRGDIEAIFEDVLSGEAENGLVPIENSLEGSVGVTLDLLLKKDVKIRGEVVIDVRHSLMALPGASLNDLREVISHPHALAQCRGFIKMHGLKTKNYPSTAGAARDLAEKRLQGVAAIAPERAARLYGLQIIERDIQDEDFNQTRFLVIALEDSPVTGRDKTSVIFALSHRPGSLYEALWPFARAGINLTKIESRPSRKALGDYVFYLDFEGHRRDKDVAEVLSQLRSRVTFLKVLGSYPAAKG
jgi:prephenate dehydratase